MNEKKLSGVADIRDESSMDAGPNGVAGLLAEEADDDMVADPRTDE